MEQITQDTSEAARNNIKLLKSTDDEEFLKDMQELQKQQQQAPKIYSYDDTGNRDRFMDKYGKLFLYDTTGKTAVYFYNGKVWKPDVTMQLAKYFDDVVDGLKDEPIYFTDNQEQKAVEKARDKFIKRTRNHAGKVAAMEEIKTKVATDANEFDKDMNLLNTPSGVIDLTKLTVSQHSPKEKLSKITTGSLDTNATAPMWNEFLNQTFLGDIEMIEFVQRAIGYTVLGKNNNRSMFILHGTGDGDGNGSNGKSVFVQTIANVLGDYGTKMSPDSFTARKYDKSGADASPDMLRLDKARFVYTSELKQKTELNESLIKDITGAESFVARPLYGDVKQFKPTGVIWLTTNYKPDIRGTDGAIWERLKFIPFEAYIPVEKQDHNLIEKLSTKERDGIMNWIIEGVHMYLNDGLKVPNTIVENKKAYRKELDVVQMFIDDNIEDTQGRHVFLSDVRYRYVQWQKNAGIDMKVSDFAKRFSEYFKGKKYKSGSIAFHDIKLIDRK